MLKISMGTIDIHHVSSDMRPVTLTILYFEGDLCKPGSKHKRIRMWLIKVIFHFDVLWLLKDLTIYHTSKFWMNPTANSYLITSKPEVDLSCALFVLSLSLWHPLNDIDFFHPETVCLISYNFNFWREKILHFVVIA